MSENSGVGFHKFHCIQITKKRLMSITVIYQGMSLTVLYTL